MMKMKKINVRQRFFTALAVAFCLLFILPFFSVKTPTVSASASEDNYIKIHSYTVEMTVGKDRQVRVEERIDVEFLYNRNMFYRAFPIENARFYDISASCEGNGEFSYYIADNPDVDGFFDLNMTGGTKRGNRWIYKISFTMENGGSYAKDKDGMIIDVVPFGSTVGYHNVTATVHFPYTVTEENCVLYKGYGSTLPARDLNKQVSADGKTLTFSKDYLPVSYNEDFGRVVQGVTLDFTMDGEFDSYFVTRFFTDGMWKIVLGGIVAVALAIVLRIFTKKHNEIVTVVNLTAPDEMDPMTMGKTLDGAIDNEDVTSMIYYFAHKGWLDIDLEDEKNPLLIKKIDELPKGESAPAKTLFKGLFKKRGVVSIEDLKYKFCEEVDKARLQTKNVKMYDGKSVFGYFVGGLVGVALTTLTLFIFGVTRLNGYTYGVGMITLVPIGAHLLLGFIRENYRYKWKKSGQIAMRVAIALIEVVFALIFVFAIATHVTTEFENLVLILFAYACVYVADGTLSRREDYVKKLGEILGFKDFIVYTEEDKIKFMLEENPQLYYKILPYAQVLGVTNEWEKKFENILIEPPTWCHGTHSTVFDYMIFNRTMSHALMTAMQRPDSKGGGGISGAGGGGSFGGFGGGGFGGGGFGSR